jgi:hypothetical protein
MDELLSKLGKQLIDSPFLAIMVQDEDNNIVWHNKLFAQEFDLGDNLVGRKCYEVSGSPTKHNGCPSEQALKTGKHVCGWLDWGEKNFFFVAVPLDEKHAAELHVRLPKEPDNKMVIS